MHPSFTSLSTTAMMLRCVIRGVTLDAATQSSNVAQAARIPAVVALAGLKVAKGDPLTSEERKQIRGILQDHAEVLAEAEHNYWMVERMLAGWRYAKLKTKDPVRKLHPLLIPYAQLPSQEQDKDRRVVSGQPSTKSIPKIPDYIERVERVGFRIEQVNSGKGSPDNG